MDNTLQAAVEKRPLMTTAEYARVIKPLLPADAFARTPGQLWIVLAHLTVICLCWLALRSVPWWIMPFLSLVIGHSMACMAFIAHDLSHGSVVSNRLVRRPLEWLLWGLSWVPASMWHRVHNQTHHLETNTVNDPDRMFRRSESSPSVDAYAYVFYAHRASKRWAPLVFLNFLSYTIRHLVTALLPGETKLRIVSHKPAYSRGQKAAILLQLVFIAALQVFIFHLVGESWGRYLWAAPVPVAVTSMIVMVYIFTNHCLNPLCDHTDPLLGTTSVIVPRWMDKLHDNFSYHTEHHLFPGISSRYLPRVSELLSEHFPGRYNRIPLGEAWRRLWAGDVWVDESHCTAGQSAGVSTLSPT